MMRLDKLLAHSGFGSRKEVKRLIRSGVVKVNGVIVKDDDYKVAEDKDSVMVEEFKLEYQANVYLMMNKPKGYLCANYDNYQNTVFDLIPEYNHLDLFCVGRLDKDTTGLLLITNDGEFSYSITKPKKNVFKQYEALIEGKVSPNDYDYFQKGVIIDNGYQCLPAKLEVVSEQAKTSLIRIEIREGKFHQIKKMVKAINCEVLELKRLKINNLELDKSLELGDYRCLSDEDIQKIF